MKINEITQQAIEQNREAVEKCFQGIVALQEKVEGFAEKTIEKAELVPEEGRNALKGLLRLGREYREGVTAQITKGREELERMFPQVH